MRSLLVLSVLVGVGLFIELKFCVSNQNSCSQTSSHPCIINDISTPNFSACFDLICLNRNITSKEALPLIETINQTFLEEFSINIDLKEVAKKGIVFCSFSNPYTIPNIDGDIEPCNLEYCYREYNIINPPPPAFKLCKMFCVPFHVRTSLPSTFVTETSFTHPPCVCLDSVSPVIVKDQEKSASYAYITTSQLQNECDAEKMLWIGIGIGGGIAFFVSGVGFLIGWIMLKKKFFSSDLTSHQQESMFKF